MYFTSSKKRKSNVVCNVPHSGTKILPEFLSDFVLKSGELKKEVLMMSDLYTDELYCSLLKDSNYIISKISRLVVDIERFHVEKKEPMSKVGMSAFYTKTSDGNILRILNNKTKKLLLEKIYKPYHKVFTDIVSECLKNKKSCLILDCHSFPEIPRLYEEDRSKNRPDICIGVDDYHTPKKIAQILKKKFELRGYTVKFNSPFSGSIVPMKYYRKNKLVSSVMIEINRKLYMNETTFKKNKNFVKTSSNINSAIRESISDWEKDYEK